MQPNDPYGNQQNPYGNQQNPQGNPNNPYGQQNQYGQPNQYGQNPYGQPPPYFGYQVDLPTANTVQGLGIASLICMFLISIVGLVLAIIALSMASTAKAEYNANPGRYTEASLSRINAGRICAIIALSVLGFALLVLVFVLAAFA